ncbi:MAG: MetQ/NlpA family ABC transporter substrate-binding protein [Turicibacter sp.]
MKKLWLSVLSLACVFTLGACGNETNEGSAPQEDTKVPVSDTLEEKPATKENTTLKIGASNVPHAEILEQAIPLLSEKGIDLDIVVFQDYVLPNKTLTEGELDANYFQHIPYLNSYNTDNGTNIVNAGGIHIEPIGVYSKDYTSLNDLPEGATIIMSSSVADHGRMLSLLQTEGLITLDPAVEASTATIEDITENPKNLVFKADIDAGLLVRLYEGNEGDAVLINTNYALDGGLNPMTDAIALEGSQSPYVNIIGVNAGDENREDIQTLVEVLRSPEIQKFIVEKYSGSVVPVSE